MPEVVLDRSSDLSLSAQIYQQIASAVRLGGLPHGAQLPSTRLLAKMLGVSRNTVLSAYEELTAEGLIYGEKGSGMRVSIGVRVREFGIERLMREACYPRSITVIEDPDGNPLYINF